MTSAARAGGDEYEIEVPAGVCPLSTREIIDKLIDLYEAFAGSEEVPVHVYTYQLLFIRRCLESVINGEGAEITALWARQIGKCLQRGTPVIMFDGSTRAVEDVRVGDLLMGDDSTPRRVLSLSRGRESMVRVTPGSASHDSYVVNKSHILSLKKIRRGSSYECPRSFSWETVDVEAKDLLDKNLSSYRGYSVGVVFPEKEVPVDPYWLGLWLGDGRSRDTGITTADSEVREAIVDYAEHLGLRVSEYEEALGNAASTYAIVGDGSLGGNPLLTGLKQLNVLKNKHVPFSYQANSREVRLELLAGLIDSDGYCHTAQTNQSNCELTFVNEMLARGVQKLVRSLGYRASLAERRIQGKSYWRIHVYGELWEIPTRVPRKKRVKRNLKDNPRQYGITLEELPEDDYYGFTLDGNRRFLLGDYTVTHNTEAVHILAVVCVIFLPWLGRTFNKDERLMPFRKGFSVGVYAPAKDKAQIPYTRIRDFFNGLPGERLKYEPGLELEIISNRHDQLTLSNGSEVICRTASPNVLNEGETHHLLICEETQRMSQQKIDKELKPTLASTNGTTVKIGTVGESRGGFHRSIKTNIEVFKESGVRNHFQFNYLVAIEVKQRAYEQDGNPFHLNYKKWIEGEIKRLGGTESIEFKMNFMCLWQDHRFVVVNMDVLKAQRILTLNKGTSKRGVQVAGLDLGKTTDKTVLTTMVIDTQNPIVDRHILGSDGQPTRYFNKTVIDWLMSEGAFEGGDGQYHALVTYIESTAIRYLAIDSTGMGAPIFERIQAMLKGRVICIPVVFSPYGKMAMYKYYLQEVNSGRVRYAASPETQQTQEFRLFEEQHEGLTKESSGNVIHYQAEEGEFDDFPDSGALACWAEKEAGSGLVLPNVVVESTPLVISEDLAGRGSRAERYRSGRLS